jgi:hypothetical protein
MNFKLASSTISRLGTCVCDTLEAANAHSKSGQSACGLGCGAHEANTRLEADVDQELPIRRDLKRAKEPVCQVRP